MDLEVTAEGIHLPKVKKKRGGASAEEEIIEDEEGEE
jgi:hypothetical protein